MHQLRIESVKAVKTKESAMPRLHVAALALAPTSGWSGAWLSPRYYVMPPADGVWEFDFQASPPGGIVLQVVTPIVAHGWYACPEWAKKVKVIGENAVEADIFEAEIVMCPELSTKALHDKKQVVWRKELASFDDSFNIIGHCGGLSLKMKKLHHTLTVVVVGPDDHSVEKCFKEALGLGLVAAIVAAFITGGAALNAAVAAFVTRFAKCLGDEFEVRMEDKSEWIEWCT